MKKCKFVSLGHIVKPQGKKGEVRLLLNTAEGRRNLKEGTVVYLELKDKDTQKKEIQYIWELPGKARIIIVKFKGVDSRIEAYKLVGYQVKIKEENLQPLEKDIYYFFQLKNCSVKDKENRFLGKVEDILSAGENELLVVRKGSKEILIPFVKSICLSIDLKKKEIVVDLPDGLLNLDEI